MTLAQGETAQLSISAQSTLPPDATTSWQTSNASVALVDGQGRVTAKGPGSADITAVVTSRGNSANAKGQVNVKGPPTRLTLLGGSGQAARVATALPVPVTVRVADAAGNPAVGATVRFTAKSPSGAAYFTSTVVSDRTGDVEVAWTLGTEAGKHVMEATLEGGTATTSAESTAAAADAAQLEAVAGNDQTGSAGEVLAQVLRVRALDAFGNPVPGVAVTWEAAAGASVRQAAAQTDASGHATAEWQLGSTMGEQMLVASSSAGAAKFRATATRALAARVQVSGAVAPLTSLGETRQLTAAAFTASNTIMTGVAVSWTALNPAIVQVSAAGVVTAVAPGAGKVVATADGKADTVTVNVQQALAGIRVQPTTIALTNAGSTAQASGQALDAGGAVIPGAPMSWRSVNSGVATVDQTGRVQAVGAGTTQVIAYAATFADTAVVTVTQVAGIVTITPATHQFAAIGATRQFTAVARSGNAVINGVSFTWNSLDPAVASVSAAGVVTAVANGTARIVASANGQADTATVVVKQTPTRLVLTPSPLALTVGASQQLSFVAYDANDKIVTGVTPVWTSSAPATASVNNSGMVLASAAGTAHVTAQVNTLVASTIVSVASAAPPRATSIRVSPRSDTIRAITHTVKLAATAQDSAGNAIGTADVQWSSLNPAVAVVSNGIVTGKAMGTALILAISTACASCTDTVAVIVRQDPVVMEVAPATLSLEVSAAGKATTLVKDAAGVLVTDADVVWHSSDPAIAKVDATGNITALKSGTASITAATTNGISRNVAVTVKDTPPTAPPPPVASDGEFVVFPNKEIEFIIGPQLRSGSSANPWPWFDENAREMGIQHGTAFPAVPTNNSAYINANYYDQALAQYINYYRTGDQRYLTYARKIADSWWASSNIQNGSVSPAQSMAPRNISLAGLVLRALDGRPEMWEWITAYTNWHLWNWGERRLDRDNLHYGVRDGGYALLFGTYIAAAHPNAGVRAEYRSRIMPVARDYYVRLQESDGSWTWNESSWPDKRMQPFMVGLLLEALSGVHKLTGDPQVAAAITKSADNLWTVAYRKDQVVEQRPQFNWRGMWYTVYADEGPTGTTSLRGGTDTNSIREVRQLNATIIHAFGYAYRVSGNSKYLDWGDEIFAATFGRGRGPRSDALSGLADFREKEYNQSYRSAGRYLAYRAGAK